MTPSQCSHCGKPIFTGFLCPDCQALRVYQPHALTGGNTATSALKVPIDRSALFAVTVLCALALAMAMIWPAIERTAQQKPAVQRAGQAMISDAANKLRLGKDLKQELQDQAPPASEPNDASSSVPNSTVVMASGPPRQEFHPQPKRAFSTGMAEGIAVVGNYEVMAHQTLDVFLADYCIQRSKAIGKQVMPISIGWLPEGTGASITFDEGGEFRQGTAQFAPLLGWTWLSAPENKTPNQ